jgi:uncharacterized protein (DUF1800 family)
MKRCSVHGVCALAIAGLLTGPLQSDPAPDDEATIVHVLNRAGYGPKPGDVGRIRQIGLRQYLESQLHPERISDAALEARLQSLTTLAMSSRALAEEYERPALEARRARRQQPASTAGTEPPPSDQRPDPMLQRAALPLLELSEQKILRAVYSERQLEAVLIDFWFNHFNVDARKGPGRILVPAYERDVIRPHVLGNFRDLLEATAKSPAMLFYLDNWMSVDPAGARRPFGRMSQAPPRASGLNENYARELLELHTLGVDGGYTQKDVTEVARAFTGWSINMPRLGGGYVFRLAMHDAAEKTVLGHRIAAGGEGDGQRVLDVLAAHPSTARFIATKLTRRFVSDDPPPPLVARVAETFSRTKGDLRAVMTTLLTSPEFLSPEVRGAKVKTPFEFIVSALRSTDADVASARALVRSTRGLGMPLYQCQPPTGYKDTADGWVNTGALVNRMNEALAIARGTIPGVRITEAPSPEAILGTTLSDITKTTIARATTLPQALALALGSPEFQRR